MTSTAHPSSRIGGFHKLAIPARIDAVAQFAGLGDDDKAHLLNTGNLPAELADLAATLNEGDEVIIPEPFYANYLGFGTQAGVRVCPIESSIETGFALPPIAEFEKRINSSTKAIMICNPGNPTGYLYTRAELEALRDLCLKYDLFLFSDEVYREFCYDGNEYVSVMSLSGLEEHAIVVESVSKIYSACGARIGALVTRNKSVIATAMKFAQARLSPPTYAQIASEAALETPQSYFDDVISEYKDRRDTLITELQKIEGVTVATPKGAFYCIAKLPIDNADKFAQWLLESYDFNGETVMVAPAAGFYSTPNVGLDEVRIAYVLKKDDLIKSVQILKEAITVYNKL